jgi:hypothetical protein
VAPITYDQDWFQDGTGWVPVCPDCHRPATPQGTFAQCNGKDWSICYRNIDDVIARIGPPPAPKRDWPPWLTTA